MIASFLTNTFRNFAIFHHIKGNESSIILFNKRIRFYFRHAILDRDVITEKLGIPVKPKVPINPFFRYMIEIRASVVKQHPTLTTQDHMRLISKMWHLLDESKRRKYRDAFEIEAIAYRERLAEYEKLITKEEKQKFKQKRKEIKDEVEKRKYVTLQRKKALELDKPKRPQPNFFNFLKAQPDRQPNEIYYHYLRRKSAEWKSLSESEKEIYRTRADDIQNFKEESLEWKGKMIKLGIYDVMRSEIPNYVRFDNVLKPKETKCRPRRAKAATQTN